MKAWLIELVVVFALCCALMLGGFALGSNHTQAAWDAAQAQAAAAANTQFHADVAAGQAASAASLSNQRAQEARYAELDTLYQNLRRRFSLVVPSSVRTACSAGPVQPDPGGDTAPDRQAPGGIALPAPGADTRADAVPALTLAAVRLWNGALSGADAPAGACGADATAIGADAADAQDSACAQASGLDLDDAWRNQRVNAQSCAADRGRHQALIDYLHQREGGNR